MSLFYITKDIERAAGIDLSRYSEIYILTNRSPLADLMYQSFPDRVILNGEGQMNTLDLVKYYATYVEQIDPKPQILVFKNSPQIERLCSKRNWQLVNPSAELAQKFERKIDQSHWLQIANLNIKIPDSLIAPLETLSHQKLLERFGNPYILQYNIGHTGEGTKLVTGPYSLEQEILKTPKREVKVTKHLKGKVFTVNVCVCANEIKVGKVSLQLTGIPLLTSNPLATVGNDWIATHKLYSDKIQASRPEKDLIPDLNKTSESPDNLIDQVESLAHKLGQAMRLERWQGLFGIDVLQEETTNNVYFIEINSRQPASATFETWLANLQQSAGPMDWHLNCLLDLPMAYPVREYDIHSLQIFLRQKSGNIYDQFKQISLVGEYDKNVNLIEEKMRFNLAPDNKNYFIIPNSPGGSEVLRIQQNFPL